MAVSVFNIAAFFIVLREVLEACLVVGIVLACLKSLGNTHLKKWVWYGAGAGIGLSLALGIAFTVVFYRFKTKLFAGKTEKIFEGIVFLIAAALLTWMLVWMQKMGHKIKSNLEQKVETILDNDDGGKWGIFFMVFVQVLREGIETILFLFGAANSAEDPDAWRGIPLPGILGVIVGLVASYALFRGLVELDIMLFFAISSAILILFSAGLTSHAFHELQEAEWFGIWKLPDPNPLGVTRDWWNATMWDTKGCCDDKKNEFFALLRALFGYQDTPTFVEWGTYFAYWIFVVGLLLALNWNEVCRSRRTISKLTKGLTAASLSFTFVAFIYVLMQITWTGVLTMTLAFLLSIAAAVTVYDNIALRVAFVKNSRKVLIAITGWSLALLTMFISALHIAQMACDETGVARCSLPKFYYFGLIFTENWASTGRGEKAWVSLAVLSWSLTITVFLWGTMALGLILYSKNIDSEGHYYVEEENIEQFKEVSSEDIDEVGSGRPTTTPIV